MNKFKPGDRVRLLEDDRYSGCSKGDIGKILDESHGLRGWLVVNIGSLTKGMRENDNRWELAGHINWKDRLSRVHK